MRLGARLGDAARLWETRFEQDGVPVVLYTIVWRSRGALGYLSVAGVGDRLKPADALALARRQQARIVSTTRRRDAWARRVEDLHLRCLGR